jgi:hypothetical protein
MRPVLVINVTKLGKKSGISIFAHSLYSLNNTIKKSCNTYNNVWQQSADQGLLADLAKTSW